MRRWTLVLTGWLLASLLTVPGLHARSKDSAEAEHQQLTRRVAQLKAENAELEVEKAELEDRIVRYRNSLDRAVAALNRLRAQKVRTVRGGPEASPDSANDPRFRRSALEVGRRLLSQPRTRAEGKKVVVSGEITNPHRELLGGTLVIELFRGGMPIDELRLPFEVKGYSRKAYSTTFELRGYAAGSYSARVGFAY